MLDFVAIDFETANVERDACAVGLVLYQDGIAAHTYYTLINPHSYFDAGCTAIHGITAADVEGAPDWPEVYAYIFPLLRHYPAVSHTPFDHSVLVRMCAGNDLKIPKLTWYDSCNLFQQNRPGLACYRLNYLCDCFGISLRHHEALSDAEACGQLFLMLLQDESTAIYPFFPSQRKKGYFRPRTEEPADMDSDTDPSQDENCFEAPAKKEPIFVMPEISFDDVDFSLEDATICITGEAPGVPRPDLIEAAQYFGAKVASSCSRKVDYIFIGAVDLDLVGDKVTYKTHKVRDAEAARQKYGKPYLLPLSALVDALHLEDDPDEFASIL